MLMQRIQPFKGTRPSARPLRSGFAGPNRRCCSRTAVVVVRANVKADDILAKAKATYESGDRLQAMKLYEDVMNEEPSLEQRRAALFGQTAVHAAFGDVELAQMTLREALRYGLEYEKALQDPSYVAMVTSPQISIQLRRFAQQITNAMANRSTGRSSGASSRPPSGQDLDAILGSSSGGQADVDTSIPGIIRRVVLVLLVGVALGVGLWFLGLEYLFPKTG